MRKFVAIHQHQHGTTVSTFASRYDAVSIWNALPTDDDDCENPEWELTQVDMAHDLGLNFDADARESVEIHEIEETKVVDMSPYGAQTGVSAC